MRVLHSVLPMFGLLAQSGLARLSDQMAAIIYGWGLLNDSGSSASGATVMATSFGALVIGTFFAGRLINHFGARVVALSGTWLSVSAAALIALLLHLDLANPALIAVLAALGAILDGPAAIASETHYPQVARMARFDLIRLNTIDDSLDGTATLVAPATGVVIVSAFGLAGGATTLTLLALTAALILTASFPRFKPIRGSDSVTFHAVGQALLADRLLTWLTVLFSIAIGVFVAVELVMLPRLLHGMPNGASQLTLFLVTGGLASLSGAALSKRFAASRPLPLVLAVAFLSLSAGIGLLAFSIETPVLLASAVLMGIPSGLLGPLAASIFQTRPPRALRADMQALSGALIFAAAPIAVLTAGIALDALPIKPTLAGCAAMMALGAIVVTIVVPSISTEKAMQGRPGAGTPPEADDRGNVSPPQSGGRSVEVDALRGLALFGIIIVNAPYFAGPLTGLPTSGSMDSFAIWLTGTLFAGKFFLIFSLLFGFGFATLLQRAERDGSNLHGKFMRRLFGLFVFGALHACFLFFGDILMLYALLGLLLWFCRNWPTRRLIVTACIVYLFGVALQTLALLVGLEEVTMIAPAALAPGTGYLGGFFDVTIARLAELPLTLGFVAAYNGLPALSMFLMGLALGRNGAFPPDVATFERYRGYIWFALICGATISGIAMLVPLSAPWSLSAVSFAAQAASAPVLSFGLVGLALYLLQRYKNTRLVGFLAKSGGSSLSGYILHSILLGAIFYGWGLGQYGSLGAAAVMAIAAATFLTIVLTLNVWRRYFRYGPDEWLLRSFVDLQWKPLRSDPDRE